MALSNLQTLISGLYGGAALTLRITAPSFDAFEQVAVPRHESVKFRYLCSSDGAFACIPEPLNMAYSHALSVLRNLKNELKAIELDKIDEKLKNYIKENPKQTEFLVVAGFVVVCPKCLTVPVLNKLGFTKVGSAGGSFAAKWQFALKVLPARSLFSKLQSAAMGGYGAPILELWVRLGASGIAYTVMSDIDWAAWTRWFQEGNQEDESDTGQSSEWNLSLT